MVITLSKSPFPLEDRGVRWEVKTITSGFRSSWWKASFVSSGSRPISQKPRRSDKWHACHARRVVTGSSLSLSLSFPSPFALGWEHRAARRGSGFGGHGSQTTGPWTRRVVSPAARDPSCSGDSHVAFSLLQVEHRQDGPWALLSLAWQVRAAAEFLQLFVGEGRPAAW